MWISLSQFFWKIGSSSPRISTAEAAAEAVFFLAGAEAAGFAAARRASGCFLQYSRKIVYTKDGKLSAQWEHTLAVTETGIEILTY